MSFRRAEQALGQIFLEDICQTHLQANQDISICDVHQKKDARIQDSISSNINPIKTHLNMYTCIPVALQCIRQNSMCNMLTL